MPVSMGWRLVKFARSLQGILLEIQFEAPAGCRLGLPIVLPRAKFDRDERTFNRHFREFLTLPASTANGAG